MWAFAIGSSPRRKLFILSSINNHSFQGFSSKVVFLAATDTFITFIQRVTAQLPWLALAFLFARDCSVPGPDPTGSEEGRGGKRQGREAQAASDPNPLPGVTGGLPSIRRTGDMAGPGLPLWSCLSSALKKHPEQEPEIQGDLFLMNS